MHNVQNWYRRIYTASQKFGHTYLLFIITASSHFGVANYDFFVGKIYA